MKLQAKMNKHQGQLGESLGFVMACALKGLDDEQLREDVTEAVRNGAATGTLVVVAAGKVLELDLFGDGVVPFGFRVK